MLLNPGQACANNSGERLVVRGDVCVLLRQELHLLGLLLQLRLQGGGVLPREVGHQLREIGDPRAQHVQFLGVLLLISMCRKRSFAIGW